ncbi:MAG: type II toxin-antitoxin system HicA family toxin [Chloroflexi bacterium]|nr:type II toxin-antitoxin system HicA family toxin [Chloroflexota bacterium]
MSRIPALSGGQIIRALERAGFTVTRQRGSHIFLDHPDSRATVVPIHGNESIGRGLLVKILRDVEMSRDEFMHYIMES